MKRSLLALFIAFSTLSTSAQILFNQATGITTGGMASQDFETAYNQYDCEAVDDFTVPNGSSWNIDSIMIFGQYSATASTVTGLILTLYQDDNASPGDYITSWTWNSDYDGNGDGDMTAVFDCQYTLEAGRYWISARGKKTFGNGGGQFYWTRDSLGSGVGFHWKNPTGGFGTSCSTFTVVQTCVPSIEETATAFIIYGCADGPTLNALPEDTTVCSNSNYTITPGGGSSVTYSWNNGATSSTLLADSSGFYQVSVTDNNSGCLTVGCVDVTVLQMPTFNLEDDTICIGGNQATFLAPSCPNCQAVWSDGSSGPFYSTSTQGQVYVTLTDTVNGCSVSDTAYVTVEDPDLTFIPGNQVDLCEGDTVTIGIQESYPSYAWNENVNGNWAYYGGDPSYELTEGGQYSLEITSAGGCKKNDTITITERPLPQPTIVFNGWTGDWKVKLKATLGYQSYEWSDGKDEPEIKVGSNKTMTVTVTDEYGCQGVAEFKVKVAGIDDPVIEQLTVYPNPANEQLNIQWPENWVGQSNAVLMDALGKEVMRFSATSNLSQIDVSTLSTGQYIMRVNSPIGVGHATIIIE